MKALYQENEWDNPFAFGGSASGGSLPSVGVVDYPQIPKAPGTLVPFDNPTVQNPQDYGLYISEVYPGMPGYPGNETSSPKPATMLPTPLDVGGQGQVGGQQLGSNNGFSNWETLLALIGFNNAKQITPVSNGTPGGSTNVTVGSPDSSLSQSALSSINPMYIWIGAFLLIALVMLRK